MFMQQQLRQLERAGLRPGQSVRARELFRARAEREEYQSINADIDGDGREDQQSIRLAPIVTGTTGQSLATTVSADFEIKPLKLFKGLNFVGMGSAVDDAIVITSLMVGQTDMLVSKGTVPWSGLVSKGNENLLDLPWAGPGLSIYISVKNVSGGTVVFHGAIRGLAVTG